MPRNGNVVVAQGGGPTPVINASLYGVVREATTRLSADSCIWGARNGILGVLRSHFVDLRKPGDRTWKHVVGSPGSRSGFLPKDAE